MQSMIYTNIYISEEGEATFIHNCGISDPKVILRTTVSVLAIVLVGQHEVLVCLDFVLTFFSPSAVKLIGTQMERQFFFSVTYHLNG